MQHTGGEEAGRNMRREQTGSAGGIRESGGVTGAVRTLHRIYGEQFL